MCRDGRIFIQTGSVLTRFAVPAPTSRYLHASSHRSLQLYLSVPSRIIPPLPAQLYSTSSRSPVRSTCPRFPSHFNSHLPRRAAPAPMDLPVVDLAPYLRTAAGDAALAGEEELRALCATVSASLRDTGALLVMDPRCSAADNDRFLDVVERYFARSADAKRLQERPHLHYQVGRCPPRSFSSLSALSNWASGFDGSGVGMVNRMAVDTGFTVLGLIPPRLDPDHCRDRSHCKRKKST